MNPLSRRDQGDKDVLAHVGDVVVSAASRTEVPLEKVPVAGVKNPPGLFAIFRVFGIERHDELGLGDVVGVFRFRAGGLPSWDAGATFHHTLHLAKRDQVAWIQRGRIIGVQPHRVEPCSTGGTRIHEGP